MSHNFDHSPDYWFPGYSNESIAIFVVVDNALTTIYSAIIPWQAYFGMLSIVLNLIHLSILFHKSMRTTSANAILSGIAIADIIYPGYMIFFKFESLSYDECGTNPGYFYMWIYFKLYVLQSFARKSSCWAALFLAAHRLYLMTFSTRFNTNSNALFGWKLVTVALLIVFPFSLNFSLSIDVVGEITAKNYTGCPGKENITSELSFNYVSNDINPTLYSIITVLDAIFLNLLPAFLFLVLSSLLCREIIKSKARIAPSDVRTLNSQKKATKLIAFMTFVYFICEFPLGIVFFRFLSPTYGLIVLGDYFVYINDVYYTIFQCTPFFINLILSNQYREILCIYLRIPDKNKISVFSSQRSGG